MEPETPRQFARFTAGHSPGRAVPAWTVLCGLALAAVGLASAPQEVTTSQPASPSFATADSNGSMIAVTGVDITGASLLYVIDTEAKQLSVYQGTGGSKATSGVRWVGARRIDLDLAVDGWNDKSEHDYKALRDQFEKSGLTPGAEPPR